MHYHVGNTTPGTTDTVLPGTHATLTQARQALAIHVREFELAALERGGYDKVGSCRSGCVHLQPRDASPGLDPGILCWFRECHQDHGGKR